MTDWAAKRKANLEARPRYVYSMYDGAGELLYIGQAVNVAERIKQHHLSLRGPTRGTITRPSTWLLDARTLSMTGPYSRREALDVERDLIERKQPPGNIQFTVRDPRPWASKRSAERAEVSA